MARASHLDQLTRGAAAHLEEKKAAQAALISQAIVGSYERISDDQEDESSGDRGAGVERQWESNRLVAESLGWVVHRRYTDNDISAYKGVYRPEFEKLLEDLEDEVIQGIVVYDLDRLARLPPDLERAIKIYDQAAHAGKRLVFRTVHDAIDLSSPDGVTLARVMVAFANKASRDTSRRLKSKREQYARTGKPVGGTRPFGWNWAYQTTTVITDSGDAVTKVGERYHVVNEAEAREIQRIADDVLAGVSLNVIIKDLNDRGICTPRGNEWKAGPLKNMLCSARLAGYRIHQGALIADPETGDWVKGTWEPILGEETWRAVSAALADRSAAHVRRAEPNRQYLLSGVLRCSECQGPLHGNAAGKYRYYSCKKRGGERGRMGCGKVSVSGSAVDAIVTAALKERMRDTVLETRSTEDWAGADELRQLKQKITELLDEYRKLGPGPAASQVLARVGELNERGQVLEGERAEFLRARGAQKRRQRVSADSWDDMPMEAQRQYVREELEALYVLPARRRGPNKLDPTRLVPVWTATGQ